MLNKALKQTSDYITGRLLWENRKLGNRTAALEQRTDDLEIGLANHTEELEVLRDENITLQTRLEGFENRARRSNILIRGLPETILDLQVTVTAMFQELPPPSLLSDWRWIECTGSWPHENLRATPGHYCQAPLFLNQRAAHVSRPQQGCPHFLGSLLPTIPGSLPSDHLQALQQHHIAYR